MFLLDTNVVSELRKTKPHGAVLAWVGMLDTADLHVPAVVIGELQAGVEKLRSSDPIRSSMFERWIDLVVATYAVLPADAAIYRLRARIMLGKSSDLYEDAFVAATAMVYGLTVVTRNVHDFLSFDVELFDPFRFAG